MKKKIKKIIEERMNERLPAEANKNVPRITADTVATHRDEVLSGARKYIYPLQHSKHRIVLVSTGLIIGALVSLFIYTVLALYKLQSTSKFVYTITQVVPFPVARTGSNFVAYENYLFELRRYMHYYKNQQKLDFNSEAGQQQLSDFKKRALDKVVNDALVKQLAEKNNVSVSEQEINDAITVLRAQNRLGSSDKVLEDVLKEFWGWSVKDFKRSLSQQILAQKVVSALDAESHSHADSAVAQLKSGADFAKLAQQVSEDPDTKDRGGEFNGLIDRANRDISPKTVEVLFSLKPGEYSSVINVGYGLEIVKVIEVQGDKVRAAHILFNFNELSAYLNDLKDQQKARLYLKL